ncbi:subclass B3 metallo-beta-lactamase [Qipengyuania sp. 1NDH17]|uniref:Subclass B3 metallo-beta-lactamase n=1 Tax=Qipengyuania polymorpha TaxID=2867234 RepID=A0ABS7IVM7_9SPHN|nr:subclass B3 metallo-beta-lactamase [Qipengyuania polymorpha]MBX7457537.1 subclass B3 metallo-beta-lactamase [Qipengyuania polymorpha]
MSVRSLLPLAFVLGLAGCTATAPVDSEVAAAPPAPTVELDPKMLQAKKLAFLDTCEAWDEWDKPAPPFQLLGNSFYVGTCGISAILVTGDAGHVLLDSGVPSAAPLVLANIRELGFDPKDVRYILMSHEHFDHVGAHSALADATGARIVASARAKAVLESGDLAADDPQAASGHPATTSVKVDKVMADGEVLRLGGLEFTAHTTPGHSPGAMSWTWNSCSLPFEPPICSRTAYVDSLSAVSADGYRFSDRPQYVAAFRDSIDKVRFLPCDYIVTPHPSASGMLRGMKEGSYGKPGPCQRYADALTEKLDARLAREAAE